jgi:hypothetical protein
MPVHERFEELCAFATIGELRADEWTELRQHLETCPECRDSLGSFEELYSMLADAADAEGSTAIPEGMTRRFVARAQSAGVALDPVPTRPQTGPPLSWPSRFGRMRMLGALLAVIVLVVSSFTFGVRLGVKRKRLSSAPTAPLQQVVASAAENKHLSESDAGRNEHTRKLQEQLRSVSSELERKKQALASAKAETDSLTAQIRQLEASNAAFKENQSRHNAELEQLKQDLERARVRQNDADAGLTADEEEIRKLSRKLKVTQDINTTLNEAHELIVDRNVHVLNVFPEVDANAKSPQPRGRIFYAEGKKLVFYAYDLTDTEKISAKASFYLWGEAPTVQQLVSLGKFQIDSEEQGRWVLRVTDPRLLANISSVFVTLEPDKRVVTKPSGKRMLSRLLQWKSDNH